MTSTPSPEQIADMEAHASDDLQPNIIACVSICAFLATVFVALRFLARWLRTDQLMVTDYLITFALCLYMPYCVALALCTNAGLGKHIIFMTNAKLLQIYFISSETIYSVVIVTIKWSILAFYWRVFPQVWFRRLLLGVGIFMAAWMVTTVFAIIFQCIPIEYNWDTTIDGGHCINIGQFALVTSILNVLTDVTILILPLPLVQKIQVTPQKRRGLMLLFALGGGACVVGITRAAWIGKLNGTVDATWDNVNAAYLSTIEILAGFLVACIPSYPPLFYHATGMIQSSKRSGASSGQTPDAWGPSGDSGKPASGDRNKMHQRRPVVSWNRITNTDDIDLVTQTRTMHHWETVAEEENGTYYNDRDQMSTTEMNSISGQAVTAR